MKTFASLLLYGAGITVGCSCVLLCLWELVQLVSGLLLNSNVVTLALD